MKQFTRSVILLSALVLSIGIFPKYANAQPGDPGEDPDTPVDGGVGILIAVGVGYGIKKVRDHRKKNVNLLSGT